MLIRGARQVGKTWLMREFGRTHFTSVAYVNFDDNARMRALFDGDFDIPRLLAGLRLGSGVKITPGTLLVFDEVQETPQALSSLKYFRENAPEYATLASGSRLGIALHAGASSPVGKVDFMDLQPMCYREVLAALEQEEMAALLRSPDWALRSVRRALRGAIETGAPEKSHLIGLFVFHPLQVFFKSTPFSSRFIPTFPYLSRSLSRKPGYIVPTASHKTVTSPACAGRLLVVTLFPVFADVAAVDVLQRGEIGLGEPCARRPVAQEIAYHFGMREEELVVAVVGSDHRSFRPRHPSPRGRRQRFPGSRESFGTGQGRSHRSKVFPMSWR
jgi:hypothetical protein